MTLSREENSAGHEEALLAANMRLLEMRAQWQAGREKKEKANCVALGREFGVGDSAKFGKLLKSLIKEVRGNLPAKGASESLLLAWQEVGGEDIAVATIKVEMRNGFVNVVMDNHILKQEIESFRHEQLLSGLRQRFPEKIIRGIRVKIGNKK